jgi:hypothetical protein
MQKGLLGGVLVVTLIAFLGLSDFVPRVYASSYNRGAAASYADQWAHARNSNYPNFGTGCNCNDCQNLASQALRAGGYPLHTGNYDPNSVFELWYYWSSIWGWQNSKTWSASDWFNTYVAQYPGDFQVNRVTSGSQLSQGDFIAMDLDGNGAPDHTRVIVGSGYTSTNQADYTDGCGHNNSIPAKRFTVLVDQHCIDRWHVAWDYNIGSAGLWYINVTW